MKKENGITSFYLEADALSMWLHQNGADIIDAIDGVLLDSLLVGTKHNGIAAIYEHATTPNSSNYSAIFSKTNQAAIWAAWEEFSENVRAWWDLDA